jgi:hypothetical protein
VLLVFNVAALFFGNSPDAVFHFFSHRGPKDSVTIFRDPCDVCHIVCASFLICYSLAQLWGQLSLGFNKWVVQKAKPLNFDLALRARVSMLD